MLELGTTGLKFREIVNYDSLSLVLTTKIMSGNELAEIKREVGFLYFRSDKEIQKIDFHPIRLLKLKPGSKAEMIGGSVVNMEYSGTFPLNGPLTESQIEEIKFLRSKIDDTLIHRILTETLEKHE